MNGSELMGQDRQKQQIYIGKCGKPCWIDIEVEQLFLTPSPNYLPCSNVFVKSTYESALLEEEAVLKRDLLAANAGFLGVGRDAVSLSSMKTTFDMVGRSH
jgi:hypothetical protein